MIIYNMLYKINYYNIMVKHQIIIIKLFDGIIYTYNNIPAKI